MSTFDPTTIDLSSYSMPILTTAGSLSLAKILIARQPADVPDYVMMAAKRLHAAIAEVEAALTERLDRTADLGLERSFDLLVDRIWIVLRAQLEFWSLYHHEGIGLLTAAQLAEAKIGDGRTLALAADDLLAHLFTGGIEFLQLPFPEQSAHMAARLRYIETVGFDKFVALVGENPAMLVRVCQVRYEAMVAERATREGGVSVNLRPLHTKLRIATDNYARLLLNTLYEGDQAWADTVLASLSALPLARVQPSRTSGPSEDGAVDPVAGADQANGALGVQAAEAN